MTDRFNGNEAGPAVLDVDRLLHDYFQAEMPDPWPQSPRPMVVPFRRPAARQSWTFRRLAVAAAVVLALIGYWTVGSFFPTDAPRGINLDNQGEIGDSPFKNKKAPPLKQLSPVETIRTRNGDEARVITEDIPGGGQVMHIEIIGTPKTKGPR